MDLNSSPLPFWIKNKKQQTLVFDFSNVYSENCMDAATDEEGNSDIILRRRKSYFNVIFSSFKTSSEATKLQKECLDRMDERKILQRVLKSFSRYSFDNFLRKDYQDSFMEEMHDFPLRMEQ
ncbi:CLUMA_CG020343, isoform A [Clunio marinus]|uniref:CLUMA_CG020343, isoform A n=1 Tax=Clunio marinus TaxID=568069 RepID=A0A1J1J4M8_9DIPT|nr:CLUMA_CG020343, isoform A [Clunio marinus]